MNGTNPGTSSPAKDIALACIVAEFCLLMGYIVYAVQP